MAFALPFRFSDLGYPARLILTFVLFNFCVLLLAGFSLYQSYREAQQTAELSASNLALVMEHNLSNLIQRVEVSLRALGDFYQGHCDKVPEEINRQIEQVRGHVREVEAIRITDANGILLYGTGVDASKQLSLADRPHFVRLKQQPELSLAFSQPQRSRVNNEWVLVLAQRLVAPDGGFDGMIFATVTLDYLNRLFAGLDLGSHGSISLRSDDFRFIARHPPLESVGLGVGDQYSTQALRTLVLDKGQRRGRFITDQGLDKGLKMVDFRGIADYPLFVTLALAEQDYLADWRRMSWWLALLLLVFLLGFGVVEIALYRAWQRQQLQQRELARQKALYQDLVEEVPFFVMRHQADGRISFANRVFAAFFAKQQASLEGQNWLELLSSEQGAALKEGLLTLTPEKPMGQGIQCLMHSSAFGKRWIQWGWRGFFDSQRRLEYVQALGEDISERKRSRDIQDARLRLMEYSQEHSMEALLMAMLNEVERITESQLALYHALEADEQRLSLVTWPSAAMRHLAQAEKTCRDYDLDRAGVWADLVRQHQPIMHNEQAQITDLRGLPPGHVEICRELLVPVVRKGRVVAVLWLGNKAHAYEDSDLQAATVLVELACDLVEHKRLEAELLLLASTDTLTGLDNRRSFLGKLQHELERLKRFDILHASVLMLDLDHFKSINDSLGHAAGDAVLRHCAALMREDLRKIDSVGRLGGEEFAILLVGSDTEAAAVFAERLRSKIADTPCVYQGQSILVTISIGMSALHGSDTQIDEVMNRADRALYRAKALGRNRCELETVGADSDKYNDGPEG